jgi:hypothetical protein
MHMYSSYGKQPLTIHQILFIRLIAPKQSTFHLSFLFSFSRSPKIMLILNLFVSFLTIFQTICIFTTIGQHLHNNKDNANINYNKNNDKKLDHHPSTTDLTTKPATTVVQQIINNNDNDDINDNFIIDSTETYLKSYNALTTYNPIAIAYPEEHEIENKNKIDKNSAILLQENFHANAFSNGLQHRPIERNDGEDSYINKIDSNIVNGKSHHKLQQQPDQKQQKLQSNLQKQIAEINTNKNKFLRPRRSSDDLLTEKANHNIQTDRDLFATTSSCIEPKYSFAVDER